MKQMTEQIKSIIQTLNASQTTYLRTPYQAEEFSSRIQKLATQGSAANHGSKIFDVLIPGFVRSHFLPYKHGGAGSVSFGNLCAFVVLEVFFFYSALHTYSLRTSFFHFWIFIALKFYI